MLSVACKMPQLKEVLKFTAGSDLPKVDLEISNYFSINKRFHENFSLFRLSHHFNEMILITISLLVTRLRKMKFLMIRGVFTKLFQKIQFRDFFSFLQGFCQQKFASRKDQILWFWYGLHFGRIQIPWFRSKYSVSNLNLPFKNCQNF